MLPRRFRTGLASFAEPLEDGRLQAPSAARNMMPILTLLHTFAPRRGRALEIASGTGEHVVAFARAFGNITWQPSEVDPERRASIDAWARDAALTNIAPAIELDACSAGWAEDHGGQDLIFLSNLLHLISAPEAEVLIAEAARALTKGGRFIFYGPFKRAGVLTSLGDASFDAKLRAQDADVGYKDDAQIEAWIADAELSLLAREDMPANNLAFICERPA